MSANINILPTVVGIALASCDPAKTKQAKIQRQKPASFRDTIFTNVTPTADGGAYAIGLTLAYRIFAAQHAVKMRFHTLPTGIDDPFFGTLQITPLLDGGAYAHSVAVKSFWHLHADSVERVTEVMSLWSMPPVAPFYCTSPSARSDWRRSKS